MNTLTSLYPGGGNDYIMSHNWSSGPGAAGFGLSGNYHANTQDARLKSHLDLGNFRSVGDGGVSGEYGGFPDAIVDNLSNFFGEPDPIAVERQRAIAKNRKGNYLAENFDYPQAYAEFWGRHNNGHIARTIIEKTKASQCWQLTKMAPWEYKTGDLNFSWNEVKYNRHVLDRLPEEAVPRLTNLTYSSGKASMVRYGIACLFEATFMSTPTGVAHYLATLEQIRIATVETCSYGALVSILQHPAYDDPYDEHRADPIGGMTRRKLQDMFTEECSMFGIVHKEMHGYQRVAARMQQTMSNRPGAPQGNMTVVPCGLGAYLANSEHAPFYLSGRASTRTIDAEWLHRHTVVESHGFSLGEGMAPHDPLFRNQTCGDVAEMHDKNSQHLTAAQYRTMHLDYEGFDGDADAYVQMAYDRAYKFTGVWDFDMPGVNMTEVIGKPVLHDFGCYTWGQMVRAHASNPEQVIEGLLALGPEQREKLRACLSLLKADDERVHASNGNFSTNLFDGMMAHYDFADAAVPNQGKRHHDDDYGYGGKRRRRGDEGGYELVDETVDDDAMSDTEEHEYAFSGHGRDQMLVQTVPITKRVVRTYKRVGAGDVDMLARPGEDANLTSARRVARDLLAIVGEHERSAEDLLVPGAAKVTELQKAIAEFIQTVLTMKGATPVQKLALMTELKRVAVSETCKELKINEPSQIIDEWNKLDAVAAADQLAAASIQFKIQAGFVPFLAQLQTRIVLQLLNSSDRTPLERARQTGGDLDDVSDITGLEAGWWNPSGEKENEDGQIALELAPGSNEAAVFPLPHDAYAITLAANHDVLFHMKGLGVPTELKPEIKVKEGVKQGRTDALVFSIVLSMVAAGLIVADKSGTAIETMTLARLKRHLAKHPNARPLASQAHMAPVLTAARATLEKIISNGTFSLGTGVIPSSTFNPANLFTPESSILGALRGEYKNVVVEPPPGPVGTQTPADHRATKILALDSAKTWSDAVVTPNIKNVVAQIDDLVFSTPGRTPSQWDAVFRGVRHTILRLAVNDPNVDIFARPRSAKVKQAESIVEQAYEACKVYHTKVHGARFAVGLVAAEAKDTRAWNAATIVELLDRASVVNGGFYRFCVENDIRVPFALTQWRPHITTIMGSILHVCAARQSALRCAYGCSRVRVRSLVSRWRREEAQPRRSSKCLTLWS